MAQYDGAIRINTDIDTKGAKIQLSTLRYTIVKTADEIASLRSKMNALKGQKTPTEEFKELEKFIKQTETSIGNLTESLKRMKAEGLEGSDTYKDVSDTISEMKEELDKANAKMKELVDTGRGFTLGENTEEYANLSRQLGYEKSALSKMMRQYAVLGGREKAAKMQESFKKLGNSAKGAFTKITRFAKDSSGMLSVMAGRIKSLALSFLMFNQISKAFNAIISGMKTGFTNFMAYSDSFAGSVQSMKNAMSTFGNQLAAAFAPIVQSVIPSLTALMNTLARTMTYVAQFIAILGGKSTFTKAKQVQDAYNKSLGGTAKAADKARGALAKFDDLDVLEKQMDTSGVGADTLTGDLFEEVPVSRSKFMTDTLDRLAGILERIKDEAGGALKALDRLWNEGLYLLAQFSWDALQDFYRRFLVPVGKWVLGEGLPKLFDITNKLLKSIDWGLLRGSLRGFCSVLAELAEFTFRGLLDFYEKFLAPMAKWGLNSALPELLRTLKDMGSKVKWKSLNAALSSMWEVLSKFAKGIGDGLLLFWKGIEPFVTDTLAAGINILSEAMRALSNALGMIPEDLLVALGGAVGGFLASFVVYEAVTGIMENIKDTWKAFYTAVNDGMKVLAANPYLAVAAGIAAIVGALVALDEKASERSQIEQYGQTLNSLCAEISNQAEAVKNRSEAVKNYVDDAGAAELMLAGNLADRYYDLSQKEYLTNAQKEEMKTLSERLVELIPELADSISSETGMIEAQKDEVYGLIEAKREQYRMEAAKNKIIEAYQNQLDAEQNLKDVTELVTEAQNKYNKELEHFNEEREKYLENPIDYGLEPTAQHLNEARDNWKQLTAELETAAAAFDATQESIDYLEKVMENGGKDCTDGFINGYNTEAMTGTVRESAQACIDAFRETNDSHSPSKVYESLAKDSIDGYVVGIEENTPSATDAIKAWCETMREVLAVDMLEATMDIVHAFFAEMLDVISGKWAEILAQSTTSSTELNNLLQNTLTRINANILTALTTANANWVTKWSQLVQKTKEACQEIVKAVSDMQQSIQAMCDSMIAAIHSVKSVASSLGSVGGGFGGGGLASAAMAPNFAQSFASLTSELPHLASGSVIRGGNPFMAILGDQPSGKINVETPADLIKDMVRQGIAEAGGLDRGSVPVNINLIYDGETFARLSLDDILSEASRRGLDVSVLGVT